MDRQNLLHCIDVLTEALLGTEYVDDTEGPESSSTVR